MKFFAPVLGLCICITVILTPQYASAVSLETVPLQRPTEREVESTARMQRMLDFLQRKRGISRGAKSQSLEEARRQRIRKRIDVRKLRAQSKTTNYVNRTRTFQTPTLNRSRLSILGSVEPTVSSTVYYRNGIKYFKGDGVPKNDLYAYMWLNFAMAEDHPLARSAMLVVQRRMSPKQIERAKTLRDTLSPDFMGHLGDLAPRIRDGERRNNVRDIMDALVLFRSHYRHEPPDALYEEPREICHPDAPRCIGYLDFHAMVPGYLLRMPVDVFVPDGSRGTGFTVSEDKNGTVTVRALYAETDDVFLTK